MRKNLLTHICALCALAFIPSSVMAEVLLHESFNQATETLATNDNVSSGEIAASGWTNINFSGNIYMSSTNLSYSGYKSTADVTGGSAEYKTAFAKRAATPLSASVSSGSLYMAGIVKISGMKSGGKDYLWALGVGTSSLSLGANQYARPYVMQSGDGFKFGIAKLDETSTATYIDYTASEYAYGTYLIVVEYTWVEGVKNDVIKMYINPTKGAKPESATCVPKPTQASNKNDASSFGSVLLYSSNTSQAACLIDELKVTTSWDELWEKGGDTPTPEPDPLTPPSPSASSITVNSATISWDEVENADSYVLQWKKNGTSYGEEIAIDKDVRSYDLSNLVENTKYYVQVKTVIGANSSDFAEIDFTTTAEPAFITYQGITFTKYDVTNDLPSFGERFIARNIVFSTDVNITGDLKLCLNGYSIFTNIHRIIVKNGATLTIYNNKGDGQILGGVVASSWLDLGGVIKVEDGGTLIIREGAIENIADDEDGSYAVNNLGTLVISGAPSLIGNSASIYLTSGKMITLEEGKPLTNTTPYSVNSPGQLFTSGWSACMGDATPSTYFSSAKSGFSKVLAGKNELYLVHSGTLSLSENNDNASIIGGAVGGSTDDVLMDRVFTDTQYNTICLPFALTNGQLEQIFGSGYDLQEFSYSELDGDVLNLHFNARTDLEAGKPYLIWPTQEVEDILRNGADITAAEPVDQTSDANISFHGTYAPTELEGGNKNLLFLGADNELFWPESTGNLKGFRAYFEVKGAAQKAAKRARIVKKEDSATGIDQITNDKSPITNKIIKDGQLLILRDNKTYNVIGQMVK